MFRIERFNNKAVNEIQLQFSESLNEDLGVNNIRVGSNVYNIPDLKVKSVSVNESVISIITDRQRSEILYFVELLDSDSQMFASTSGNVLQNDRTYFFLGQEIENSIRDDLVDAVSSVYDVDQETLPRQYLGGLGGLLLESRNAIRETGNSNFLSEEVIDEVKARGFGPTDRLNEEGVFEVNRVSLFPTGAQETKTIILNDSKNSQIFSSSFFDRINPKWTKLDSDPFSLRSTDIVNEEVSNAETKINSFAGMTISLSKLNVSMLLGVSILKGDGSSYVYDLPKYGYSIQENRYDSVFGRKLLTLEPNQIRLADAAVIDGNFSLPSGSDTLMISYSYIDEGINVVEAVEIFDTKSVVREPQPAIITIFSLKNFPVVLANGNTPEINGVQFLDPSPSVGEPYSVAHRAFTNEIVYDQTRLPANPGEFSVNYSVGQVYTYGAANNDGTGNGPPVASYFYKKVFSSGVDYNLDLDADEIVTIPNRDILNSDVNITFRAETILVDGIDYLSENHAEVINEYVENRLVNQNKIVSKNFPITNVFDVLNETTGEVYSISRFDRNYVYFSGVKLPEFKGVENERAGFDRVSNEVLSVVEEIYYSVTEKILKIALAESELMTVSGQKRGSHSNNDISLSSSLFLEEFFYDAELQTVSQNLAKLNVAGDFLVNYKNGFIYILVDIDQGFDLGSISYSFSSLLPSFDQLVSVDFLGYRKNTKTDFTVELKGDDFESGSVSLKNLPNSIERFYKNNADKVITLGSVQFGEVGQTIPDSLLFTASDGDFLPEFADGYHILRIVGDSDRAITSIVDSKSLIVDVSFTELDRNIDWCIINYDFSDGYEVALSYDISSVRGVYSVTDLQTNSFSNLTNLWDPSVDLFSTNILSFLSDGIKSVPAGTALAVDYSFGDVYIDYTHVKDRLRISYEWGDNSLSFNELDSVSTSQEYYVSYKYGALREKLLENFGTLTQIEELSVFPLDFDRELYRSFLIGTLQGFVNGPTHDSIKTLVSSVSRIEPEIRDLTFDEWTVNRDYLYLQEGNISGEETYLPGKFGDALLISSPQTLVFPGESYISHREGTFEGTFTPEWSGLDNDATISLTMFTDVSNVFIGANAYNPDSFPVELSRFDLEPRTAVGQPANYPFAEGHFIWFDSISNQWNFVSTTDGYGEVTTTGSIYDLKNGVNITSTTDSISLDGYGDGYSGGADGYDGYLSTENIIWKSDNTHFFFDTGPSLTHNRMSLFKDGSGYLNFQVYDSNGKEYPTRPQSYNLSYNIQDWKAKESRFVSASWRLNSNEDMDEMHLFVDGQEVSNLFKYGGRPETTTGDIYRTVADEILISSAVKNIIGGDDGETSGTTFTSMGSDFTAEGVNVGDDIYILDPTADGVYGAHSIVGVGTTTLIVSAPDAFLLTLSNINFSINQANFPVATNVDLDKFAVFSEDGYGVRTELNGLNSSLPDYSIERENGVNTIFINNGVLEGDQIVINTLGLTTSRCRDKIYNYEDGYTLSTNLASPATLSHFEIYKIHCDKSSIDSDGYRFGTDVGFSVDGYELDGYFSPICQPSNGSNGKRMECTLGGFSNIDFGEPNQVVIFGTTFSGATFETLNFSQYESLISVEYFTSISSIYMRFAGNDSSASFGSIEVREFEPFTLSENGGDFAQISDYDNGVLSFIVYGSGGTGFVVEGGCHYYLDFPTNLNINMTEKGPLFVGSNIEGANQFNGSIDQFIFLNEMLSDIRAGEEKTTRTVTQDFNSPVPLTLTSETLMLLNMNGRIDNVEGLYKSFNEEYFTSSQSVNESFGECVVFNNTKSLEVSNDVGIFNPTEGSLEFVIAPLLDTDFDFKERYYVDISSLKVVNIQSDTKTTLTLPVGTKRVESIFLVEDSSVNYAEDSKLLADGKTVILKKRLPLANSQILVSLTPIDFDGDRFSIFKDQEGYINFTIIGSDREYTIRYPISWKRNTWHRLKATWKTNDVDGNDQMRLFIDGVEGGTILWGTPGLVWGDGILYGSALIGSNGANSLNENIDFSDEFSSISLGNSFDQNNSARAKMDNVRWSSIARAPQILGTSAIDIHWNDNSAAMLPVTSDNFTKLLLDFDRDFTEIDFLSNVFSKYTPLFQVDVQIDDGFQFMPDERSRRIMNEVLKRMKPSHVKMFITYLQEL